MTFDDGFSAASADARPITGSGGGAGKGGGSASTAPDTLFSTATIRLVDLIGEGEIVGVRGGLKGVYLNDVPVQNADGSFNFKGLTAEFRVGTPDQGYMAGYPDVQTPQSVGIKVNQATPVTASISDTDADRVRVTFQFPALFLAKSDGSVASNSVQYRVEERYSGGPWVNQLGDQTLTGKTTSGYFRSHEIVLPKNGAGASAPWQIRGIRITPDTDGFNNSQTKYTNQSDIVFYSVTTITDTKFAYPDSALVGLTAQASSFGSSVPARTYLVDGIVMPVPSNYDPVARTYSGIWDGTFKQAFSNNPAWALYLVLSNSRFGLGEFVDVAAIDKWSLYEIGRYCDQSVSDGKGGTEPRFTFNGVISTQQDAFELLQLVAQVFRGLVYWSSGTVTATQDRPADPILLVTEANVIDGEISYASSGRRARHTVAIVAWNDPDNLYKQAFEVVEDPDGVARYGYNPTKVDLLGCDSRGQAHRAGLWTLFTELQQTQVASYKAGLDHAVARPGDLVAIQDPQIANIDLSGRLLAGSSASSLFLDRPVTLAGGASYTVSVTLPNGTVQERAVSSSATGTVTTLPLDSALSAAPDPAAVWLVAGPIAPRLFRIVSIREDEPHIYAVSALQHEPGKFATIDTGATFEPTTISEFPTTVLAPTGITVRESQYTDLGQTRQALTLSWTPGQPFNSVAYYVTAIRPSGAVLNLPKTASLSVDFADVEVGAWTFIVTAIGLDGKPSLPTQATYTVRGWAGQAATTVTGLSVKGGGSTFSGRSCTLAWTNTLGTDVSPYPVRNVVYVYDPSSNALVHRELLATGQTEWTYDYLLNGNEGGPRRSFRVAVSALSPADGEGTQASLLVSNPAPAGITPTLTATSENVFVALPAVTDPDFQGYLVWASTSSGFTPTDANVTVDTSSNTAIIKAAVGTTLYIRVAAYDGFSKAVAGLNVSAQQQITLSNTLFDTTDPGIPQGLTVTTSVDVAADGTVTSRLVANWTALTTSNLGKYEVAFALGAGPVDSAYVGGNFVSGNTITRTGFIPGLTYSVKVRSISQNGFGVSGWSSIYAIVAALNATPPNPVTGLTASAAFQNAFVSWVNPTNADLLQTEVWAGSTNLLANAAKVASVAAPGTSFTDNMLSVTGTKYYWVRSVNTSKVAATSFTGPVQATSSALLGAQLAAGQIDATKFAAGLQPIALVATLPAAAGYTGPSTVFNQSDGKLYRYTGGAFTKATDGADIVANSITGGQIQAFAIGAAQIAASAISADKLAVGLNTGNLIWNSDQALSGFATLAAAAGATISWRTDWAVSGLTSLCLFAPGVSPVGGADTYADLTSPAADGTRTSLVPVQGGKQYEISAYLSVHRCSGFLGYYWHDGTNYIASGLTNVITTTSSGGNGAPNDTWRVKAMVVAPATAKYCLVRVFQRYTGLSDAYVFASGLYLGVVPTGSTAFSDYAPQSRTIIDGGQVSLNSLHATKIIAGTIATDRMIAGSINVDTIAATGSISADKLKANVLTANNIVVGTGTLSSLIAGTNTTTIDGGAISANSVVANRLRIGSRGISVAGLEFQYPRDGAGNFTGFLTWNAGSIQYIDDTNTPAQAQVVAGSAQYTAVGNLFVWWDVTNPTVLQAQNGTYNTVINNPNRVVMAASNGIGNISQIYGGSIIDGTKITTLSIDAQQIKTGTLDARVIGAGAIIAGKIAADAVTAANIAANAITAKHLYLSDPSNMLTNGDLFDGTSNGWILGIGTLIDAPAPTDPGGPHRFASSTSSTYVVAQSAQNFACSPGDVLYASAMVYSTRASGSAGVLVQFVDGAGVYISNTLPAITSLYSQWVKVEGQITVPAGASRCTFFLVADPVAGASVVVCGRAQMRRASGATLIVDGSVNANKLSVGKGTNQIQNSDFMAYAVGTTPYGFSASYVINASGSTWEPPGMRSLQYSNAGTPAAGTSFDTAVPQINAAGVAINRPVTPGAFYEFSAYVSMHRCQAEVYIGWCDVNGTLISYSESGYIGPNQIGNTTPLINWPRAKIMAQAPPTAFSCILYLRTYANGGTNIFTFWTGLFFAPCTYGQFLAQTFSDWSNAGQTVIDGQGIRTNSILADRLSVTSLSAITGNVGTLTSGLLQSPSGKMQVNLTSGYIAIYD